MLDHHRGLESWRNQKVLVCEGEGEPAGLLHDCSSLVLVWNTKVSFGDIIRCVNSFILIRYRGVGNRTNSL